MSEQEFAGESLASSNPFAPANLLTARASAIAGFSFAVFSMLGQGSWTTAVTALFWGTGFPDGAVPNVMAGWGIGGLVMAGVASLLARNTLRTADEAWEAHLARAAVLVAAAAAVLAVLTIVGGLAHQP